MLLVFTIFILLLAGISFAVFVKRLVSSNLRLLEESHRDNLAAEHFRPLFAPNEEDMREFEREEKAQLAVKQSEEQGHVRAKKLALFEKLRQTWRVSPNRAKTIEMLYQASQTESGKVYLEVSESVLEAWRAGKIADLTADDLAQLLESHFWLLPTTERTPGFSFRIQQEIAALRRK